MTVAGKSAGRHDLTGLHLAANQREGEAPGGQREDTPHAAHFLFSHHDLRVGERLGAAPGQAAEVAVGVAAEVQSRDGLLPGVAPLLVRHAAVLVEADFLHQRLLVDLGATAGPAGEDAGGLPLIIGRGAGAVDGEDLEGVGDGVGGAGDERGEGRRLRRCHHDAVDVGLRDR